MRECVNETKAAELVTFSRWTRAANLVKLDFKKVDLL